MKPAPSIPSAEEMLVILLTYVQLTEQEIEQVDLYLRRVTNWQEVFSIAQRNKVAPMVYYNLEKINRLNDCPEPVLAQFVAEKEKIRHQNSDRNKEAVRFLQRFIDEKIPVALIKGVGFGQTVYDNPFYKRMNDIDILVRKQDISAIYKIYASLDYFFIGEKIKGSKEKSDKISFLAPPYVSRDYKCVIGTQWGIKTPLGPYKVNYEGIWSRVRPVSFGGLELKIMSPEDNLHHLCLHLGYFKIALRDLMDIYNLLRYYRSELNWSLFLSIVEESGSHNVVYHGLKLANRVCPMIEVMSVIHKLEPRVSGTYIRSTNRKIADLSLLLDIFSDQIQTIEKAISVFNTTDYYKEKWAAYRGMWKSILWPPRKEVIKMSLLKNPGRGRFLRARIALPYRVLWVIASELSWLVVFLLMVKTFADMFLAFVKAPFIPRKKVMDAAAHARSLGVNLDELKILQEHFQ